MSKKCTHICGNNKVTNCTQSLPLCRGASIAKIARLNLWRRSCRGGTCWGTCLIGVQFMFEYNLGLSTICHCFPKLYSNKISSNKLYSHKMYSKYLLNWIIIFVLFLYYFFVLFFRDGDVRELIRNMVMILKIYRC